MQKNRKMLAELIVSAVLTIALTGLSMSRVLDGTVLFAVQVILSLAVMIVNRHVLISGFSSMLHLSPNMDALVSLGTLAAFIYSAAVSVINLVYYKGAEEYIGETDLYFESAAMILTLILIGRFLEDLVKGRTTNAIQDLSDLSPTTALIMKNGRETEIPAEEIKVGDIFILKPGMSIPADGIIETGTSAVNESSLTGESMPVDKEPGMSVSASTINMSGYLTCRATGVGGDTAFSKILRMVEDTSSGKARISKTADRISFYFIPAVIIISVITFIVWMAAGLGVGFSISRAISVLIVSCPAALGLAAPVAIMAGSSVGARHGILYKTAQSVENTGRTQIVVMDKTGTLTTGNPKVTDIISTENDIEHRDLLLSIAYALESKSEHPLAKAICSFAQKRFLTAMETTDFEAFPGKGIRARITVGGAGRTVYAGSEAFIGEALTGKSGEEAAEFDNDFSARIKRLVAEGKTPTLFASDSGMLGVIAAADEIREGSAEAIAALHDENIHVCMVTGDRLSTSEAVGAEVGIEPNEVISEVMPDEKAAIVGKLKETGKVAMIGDGVNDAPALVAADVGIAIGAGTDVAVDAADVVLVQDSLIAAVDAIRLSKETLQIIHQNLFWAFFYNIVGIPLASGCFYKAFGWLLDPLFCALAMSISGFFVITNALRLFSFRTTQIIPDDDAEDGEDEDVL
ncbi:MAG: copper-translocating P-type ATPase [Lachnospiraceae bacterium]|nr:copper-translocating P-type ATPase [Lachnospiraceae bacterium]